MNRIAQRQRNKEIYRRFANLGVSAEALGEEHDLTPTQIRRIVKKEQEALAAKQCGCCDTRTPFLTAKAWEYGELALCNSCLATWNKAGEAIAHNRKGSN